MTILYTVKDKLYINLTNRCPCACTFCIRTLADGVYGSDSLWLQHEPSYEEVIAEFGKFDLNVFAEIVFCGYGEPLERLDLVVSIGKYLKTITTTPIRLNTNGLSDLINKRSTAKDLENALDTVSISLNAGSLNEYLKVTVPSFGECSFKALQDFAVDCKKYIPNVIFTIVDVLPPNEVELCRELSKSLEIPLRIRKLDS